MNTIGSDLEILKSLKTEIKSPTSPKTIPIGMVKTNAEHSYSKLTLPSINLFQPKTRQFKDYLNISIALLGSEYRALTHEKPDLKFSMAEEILAKDPSEISLTELWELERLLLRMMPELQLRRKAWSIHCEYQKYAKDDELKAYHNAKSIDPITGDLETLRADLLDLVSNTQKIQIRYLMRESLRNWVMKFNLVLLGLIFPLVLFAFSLVLKSLWIANSLILTYVFGVGVLGGLISAQGRMQNLADENIPVAIENMSIIRPLLGVMLAAIQGGIFAVLLYFMFVGKILQGDIFPCQNISNCILKNNAVQLVNPELARLLVWSFVAGFAEKFVPDKLFFLISKKDETNPKTTSK